MMTGRRFVYFGQQLPTARTTWRFSWSGRATGRSATKSRSSSRSDALTGRAADGSACQRDLAARGQVAQVRAMWSILLAARAPTPVPARLPVGDVYRKAPVMLSSP